MTYVQGHHSSMGVWPGFRVTIVMSQCSLLMKYEKRHTYSVAPG